MLDSTKRALVMASHLYRDKWLEAGTPPILYFFDNILTKDEQFWCFHVVGEITRCTKKNKSYKVKGGIFTGTDFTEIVPGTEEEYGPFNTYEEAREAWVTGMFNSKLDICTHRLLIDDEG